LDDAIPLPLSYSTDAKVGLNEFVVEATGGLVRLVRELPMLVTVVALYVEVGGNPMPPIPGFSFSCLLSQDIICALLSKLFCDSSNFCFRVLFKVLRS
jgi:hypothetical protein